MDIPITIQPMTQSTPEDVDITISSAAVEKIKSLKENEDNLTNDTFLRIHLQGGGCAGFQYGFMFDDDMEDDDIAIEEDGIRVVINQAFVPMLNGSIVDYESSLTGSQFLISNPNATSTCGCGSSFSCG